MAEQAPETTVQEPSKWYIIYSLYRIFLYRNVWWSCYNYTLGTKETLRGATDNEELN